MQAKITKWFPAQSEDPHLLGKVDISISDGNKEILTLRFVKVFRATHNKWGYDIKPPYFSAGKKNIPVFSIEDFLFTQILEVIRDYFSDK